jgi:hypothetical protein
MLHNPYTIYNNTQNNSTHIHEEQVAKASRKRDVYAFAILAWELLTETKPFQGTSYEIVLSSMIHQGQRPAISALPSDCPHKVTKLLEDCWSTDRAVRKSAVECYSLLQYHHGMLTKSAYDIYLSSSLQVKPFFVNTLFHRLTQLGFKVCFGYNDPVIDTVVESFVERCKVFVLVASQSYQSSSLCMAELRKAKQLQPPRPIIPIFIEKDVFLWSSQEFNYLCQLRSSALVAIDMAEVAADPV